MSIEKIGSFAIGFALGYWALSHFMKSGAVV